MNKVFPSNEILSAMLASHSTDSAELQSDPKAYIFSHYNAELPQEDIRVVENTESQVNLVLPYYSGMEEVMARAMEDGEFDAAGGDLIALLVFALVSITVGSAVGAAAAGVGGALAAESHK